uniref:Uncharacterized protein n=1 Tax=Candidatus Kentrum sp. UNK TaxID=2126344 RepID=A0A451ABB9_9GAMM|nr:MAG: hypothetical protein BECKUNK1418G_GA0071005_103210 [Candidatus Kentron sp. UNK]VFK70810.1 MAG: hypothetical protein BECKUNK1418H_GA0071006_103910 [Candidatus Kentron sp. UNK]
MRFAYPPYGPESGLLFHSKERSLQTIANHKVLFDSGLAGLGIGKNSEKIGACARNTPFGSYCYALTCSSDNCLARLRLRPMEHNIALVKNR